MGQQQQQQMQQQQMQQQQQQHMQQQQQQMQQQVRMVGNTLHTAYVLVLYLALLVVIWYHQHQNHL